MSSHSLSGLAAWREEQAGAEEGLETQEGNAAAELGVLVDRKRAGSGSCAYLQVARDAAQPHCPVLVPCTLVCCSLAGPVLGAGSRAAVESLAVPWELSPARVTACGGCAGAAAEPWPCWTGVAVLGGHEGLSQACPSWPFLPSSPAISSPPCPGCCWSLIQV